LILPGLVACAPAREQLAVAITSATGMPWRIGAGPWPTLFPAPGIALGEVVLEWRPGAFLHARRVVLPLAAWLSSERRQLRLDLHDTNVPAFSFGAGMLTLAAPRAALAMSADDSTTGAALQNLTLADGRGAWHDATGQTRLAVQALQIEIGSRPPERRADVRVSFMATGHAPSFTAQAVLTGQWVPTTAPAVFRLEPWQLIVDPLGIDGRSVAPWTLTGTLQLDRPTAEAPGFVVRAEDLRIVSAAAELSGQWTLATPDGASATATLTAERLRVGALAGAGVRIDAHGDAQGLEARFAAHDFYTGQLNGQFAHAPLNTARATSRVTARATDVALEPLLHALYGHAVASGQAALALDLSATGASATERARTLAGTLQLEASEVVPSGALAAAGAPPGLLDHLTALRFTTVSATAQGSAGVFRSTELRARGPMLELDGRGEYAVPDDALALDLVAVLRRAPGGAGIDELTDIPIPVRARGAGRQPRWDIDWHAAWRGATRRALEDALERARRSRR